jgi:hypothetical protein
MLIHRRITTTGRLAREAVRVHEIVSFKRRFRPEDPHLGLRLAAAKSAYTE